MGAKKTESETKTENEQGDKGKRRKKERESEGERERWRRGSHKRATLKRKVKIPKSKTKICAFVLKIIQRHLCSFTRIEHRIRCRFNE